MLFLSGGYKILVGVNKMRRIVCIFETLSDAGGYIAGLIVILMMSLVMVEVVARYATNNPLAVSDEISAYMLVGMIFIALAYAWKQKTHVRIEIITSRLSAKVEQKLRLVMLILAFVSIIILTKVMYGYVLYNYAGGMRSPTWLMVPLYLPQIALAIGCSLLTLQVVADILKVIKDIRSSTGEKTV